MIERSDEIIKQLNRLANDRTLNLQTRNKVREASRHIQELHDVVERIRDLHLKLSKNRDKKPSQGKATTQDADKNSTAAA